ncbi:hypothetical protein P280DRAFT_473935 [Massarina eburnea CBS 473.64]|uniref:Zn(2)-C6 fungal-type domain-containing protein n=1 Tax=Massarina eburnea CBS 473.64 TaxID=1395130 RepID=A0A6A6RM85_9PLEO|nr:hypothetical protein P280DRAFT_473935 [Massarina eburnea CBS 473.64]
MTEQDLYRPIKRIRQACQNCRRKKARCTGERPECAFCIRLSQPCTYSEEEPYQNSNMANSDKKNNSSDAASILDLSDRLSCLENQMADVATTLKSIASTVQNISRSISSNNPNISATDTAGQPVINGEVSPYAKLPSIDIIRAAADLYFQYCHNQPYSLFHESSLRYKIETEEVPTHLLFALLASTVRYSQDPFFEDKSAAVSAYASQSWKAIVMPWNGIQSETELTIVQTILLLAIIDYTDGRTQGSWIKVGLAIRLAQDSRLMVEPEKNLPAAQQEERRRVYWSFFLCDKMISCGRERPPVILDDQCKLQLPGDENEFRVGSFQQTPTLEHLNDENAATVISTLSPFAIAVVMASLLGRCAQYALGQQEEQTPSGKTLPWNPRSKHSSIHSSLLQIESELGLSEPLSQKILEHCMASDGSGTIDQHRAAPLVLAHALFFLCQCLLYHPFLLRQRLARLGHRTPQSFLAQTFHSCRTAAGALSRLMNDVKSLGCESLSTCHDPFYGYCTMVAGTIHSMFLQAPDTGIVETATESFDSSLQNLLELSFYWKSCGMMRSRLQAFRDSNGKYTQLVDPTYQDVHLTAEDANDLLECLDYSRMSTTPRRKSETVSTSQLATLSQLPSPFFEEFVNLLPFSYAPPRPISVLPGGSNADVFAHPSQTMFDNPGTTNINFMPIFDTPNLPVSSSMQQPIASSTGAPDIQQTANSTTSFSPASSHSYSVGISPGRRESISHIPVPNEGGSGSGGGSGEMGYVGMGQGQRSMSMHVRSMTSPTKIMKRPWYEASI